MLTKIGYCQWLITIITMCFKDLRSYVFSNKIAMTSKNIHQMMKVLLIEMRMVSNDVL